MDFECVSDNGTEAGTGELPGIRSDNKLVDQRRGVWKWDASELSDVLSEFKSVDYGGEMSMMNKMVRRRRLVAKNFRGYTYMPIVPATKEKEEKIEIFAMSLREFIQANMLQDEAEKFVQDGNLVKEYTNKGLQFPNGYVITTLEDNNLRGLGNHPVIKKLKGR